MTGLRRCRSFRVRALSRPFSLPIRTLDPNPHPFLGLQLLYSRLPFSFPLSFHSFFGVARLISPLLIYPSSTLSLSPRCGVFVVLYPRYPSSCVELTFLYRDDVRRIQMAAVQLSSCSITHHLSALSPLGLPPPCPTLLPPHLRIPHHFIPSIEPNLSASSPISCFASSFRYFCLLEQLTHMRPVYSLSLRSLLLLSDSSKYGIRMYRSSN